MSTDAQSPHATPTVAGLGVMAMIGILAGPFMTMIDSSIVNIALPDMARELHGSLANVQWVVSAYLLALAVALTGTAYLAKRFGTHRIYLMSLAGFTVTSALCAFAPSLPLLIGARVLQGVFGAPLIPLAMNLLFGGGAVKQMPAAAGMMLFLAPAIGPTLGGVLVHGAGWPSIFLVNVPVGIIAYLGARRLPEGLSRDAVGPTHFDATGFVLLGAGLALAIYGASQGPQAGWLAASAWPYWAAGLLILAAYLPWALRHQAPIVDLALLRRLQPALALSLSALVAVVTFVMIVLVPVYMQQIQGASALAAGLALLPQGLLTGVGTVLGNSLPGRLGIRLTTFTGMLVLTLSTVAMFLVVATTPAWEIGLLLSGRGFAIGLVIQPLLNDLLGGLPSERVPDATTFFNVVQRVGGTLGIALLATYFQERERVHVVALFHTLGLPAALLRAGNQASLAQLPPALRARLAAAATTGFHDVIVLVTVISALGLLMALLIREPAASAGPDPSGETAP
ncbi:MAG: DHA2 family efflux MFS transporter permease subunit [Deinococcales bacterium]|jgi:EmrB/QacA subfamily drug resistance transporter